MPSEIFSPDNLAYIRGMRDSGASVKDVARKYGVTVAHAASAELLSRAPKQVHELISANLLRPTTAIMALRQDDPITVLAAALRHARGRGSSVIRHIDVMAVISPVDPVREALRGCLGALVAAGMGDTEVAKKAVAALN